MDVADLVARAGANAVLSHESAAEPEKISVLLPRPGLHVTVPPEATVRRVPGVVVHRGDVNADVIRLSSGLLATRPLRTALDLMRALPEREGLVVADSLLDRRYANAARLREAAEAMRGAGSGRARRVARLADPG